jgi:DNA-directed RNA polymerase subunit beta'
MNDPANAHNSVIIMANSGARGNVSQFTQLLGMRGLMNRSYNYERKTGGHVIKDTIEVPIKDSFIDGLTINEYYNSSYGARKGMADTAMKTSKSGYMTRKLVDAAQEVIVTEDDCHTTKGVEVSAIIDTFENVVIESLYDRIVNRYSMDAIFNPKTNEQLVGPNEIITPEIAKAIEACGNILAVYDSDQKFQFGDLVHIMLKDMMNFVFQLISQMILKFIVLKE